MLLWIGLAVACGALVFALIASRRTGVDYGQLGTMSDQWLAEQRANDRPY
jgi:hypothetical protein